MQLCVFAFILISCFIQVTMIPQLSGPCEFNSGFVVEGTVVRCVCEDTDPRIIEVFWDSSDLSIVAESISDQGVATLVKNFTRNYNLATIECVSSSNETVYEYTITKVIKMAYGPDSLSMVLEPSSTEIDICPTCESVIAVTCQPLISVPPGVTSIYVNGTLIVNSNTTNITHIDKGGHLNITCKSTNGASPNLFAASSSIVTIRAPPTSAPVMTINGSQSSLTTVVEGIHQIVCRVDGGYPMVDNVTVQCGSHVPVTGHGMVSIPFNFSRELNKCNCSCWASHVTGYYNKRTSILVNILYAPQMITFTINDMSSTLTIPKGNSATFTCQADGNPEPVLRISRSNRSTVLLTQVSHLLLRKVMQCNDTDNYTCQTDNARGPSARSISMTVLCVASPLPSSPPETAIIIVATVVPIVALAVIIIIVVAVIIHRKRSRAKAPALANQLNQSSFNNSNIGPNIAHLSGSYNHLDRVSQLPENVYNDLSLGNNSSQGEASIKKDYEEDAQMYSASPLSSTDSINLDVNGVEIIPVTPNVQNLEDKLSETEESQPPDLPEKIGSKNLNLLKRDSNPYKIPPLQDQNKSPTVEMNKPPPIPCKKYVNVMLKQKNVDQDD